MSPLALRLAVRLALCAAITWLAWRIAGPGGLLLGALALGLALPKPLLQLASELRHMLRWRVWRDLEGRHYVYRGHPVQVLEDVSHCRWVLAADVRTIAGTTASDGALALTYPNGFRRLGEPAQPHFSDEALLMHLAREADPRASRFRHWVEREIAFPARRVRERLGIRLEAPDAPANVET